jgi:hypothetical protein
VLVTRAAAVLLVATAIAHADQTDRCIAESEAGQRMVLTRHFVAARPHLLACGAATCPAPIARDCAQRASQADASIATVIASAELADGGEARDAHLLIDDTPAQLGEALSLDPGEHHFAFERDGRHVDRTVDVEEGARMQRVVAMFPPSPSGSRRDRMLAGELVGATGIASIGAGAVLGIVARSDRDAERSACASPSDCSDYEAAQRDYRAAGNTATASTICIAIGGAMFATGVVLWLVTRERSAVAVAPSLNGFIVTGQF